MSYARRKPKPDEAGAVTYRREAPKKQIKSFWSAGEFQDFLRQFRKDHAGKLLSDYYSLLNFPAIWTGNSKDRETLYKALNALFTPSQMVLQHRLETSDSLTLSIEFYPERFANVSAKNWPGKREHLESLILNPPQEDPIKHLEPEKQKRLKQEELEKKQRLEAEAKKQAAEKEKQREAKEKSEAEARKQKLHQDRQWEGNQKRKQNVLFRSLQPAEGNRPKTQSSFLNPTERKRAERQKEVERRGLNSDLPGPTDSKQSPGLQTGMQIKGLKK